MKSFAITAGLAAASFSSFFSANSLSAILKTRQAAPQSCHKNSVLCPGCDGSNITADTGEQWAVSCGFAIEAESEVTVGGVVSTDICLDACDDNDGCFGVTFAPNGSCIIASGQQKGLSYASGYTNFARVAPATTISASRMSITATTTTPGGTRTTRASITTTDASASPTYSGTSSQCEVDDEDLCPKCSGGVAVDNDGDSWRVLCDSSINSNGSYSPQEWLSPEECLEECGKHDFCTGVTYFGERSCELAKANPEVTFDEFFTAFLPLLTPTASSTVRIVTSRTGAGNTPLTAAAAGPTVSIQPINPGCNTSAVTCDECDGYQITDQLNGSYTAICAQEPMCLTTDRQGEATQEECLQKCDQDAACLAAMWSPDSLFCNLCLRGMQLSRVAGELPYVLLAADIDGDDDATTTSTSSAKPTLTITLPTTISASRVRTITDLPAPFPTEPIASNIGPVGPVIVATLPNVTSIRTSTIAYGTAASSSSASQAPTSSAATSQAPIACPASENRFYVDAGSKNAFAVGCDSRFDAAHSSYVTASNFEACAALCTASCDGVQFGATSRCGLYNDITFIGGAQGWTAAARITVPGTTGLPASITSVDVSAIVSATTGRSTVPTTSSFVYASPVTSASVTSRRSNVTLALQSPSVTRANPGPYSLV